MDKITNFEYLNTNIAIYKRQRSNLYQTRFKLSKSNIWIRKSCKTSDKAEAITTSWKLLYEYEAMEKHNLPITTRKFKTIALEVIKQLQTEIDNGTAKVIFKDYIAVLNNYLIPFFGKFDMASCKNEFNNFDSYRLAKHNRNTISKSTIKTHNAALHRVYQLAKEQGYITKIPKLKNNGTKTKSRKAFSNVEHNAIIKKLRHWYKKIQFGNQHKNYKTSNKNRTKMMRQLLYDYVLVISNCGMRHGTETSNLKWKDIDFYIDYKTKKKYLRITVNGKIGERVLIARDVATAYIERIKNRDAELANYTLEELFDLKLDKHVFRLANGTKVSSENLSDCFRYFLKQNGFAEKPLYAWRHTYCTYSISKGISEEIVAKNLGTSVRMLDAHYNQITSEMNAEILSS